MKRLLSIVTVFSLLFSLLSIPNLNLGITFAKTTNPGATFAAVRWIKIGFDRDGLPLYPAKDVPWAKSGISWWGRDGYPMPNAYLAREANGIARPALINDNVDESAKPVLWTEVYLSISPEGGRSQEYDKWYAVLDSAGQLWFDPDGAFHDPRYNPKADPRSPYYVAGSCRTSSTRQNGIDRYAVDPTSDNNTQGPYILNPEHPLYKEGPIIFEAKGTRFGDRKWQVGYVDMVDYLPTRAIYSTDPAYANKPNDEGTVSFNTELVIAGQWDIGLRLVNFKHQSTQRVTQGDEMFHEYHARKRNGNYDPYEYIYRKGPGNWDSQTYTDPWGTPSPYVQAGDIRLTDMSFKTWDGTNVVNYPANSIVKPGDADCPYDYDNNGLTESDEYKALNFFQNYIKHTETIEANGLFDTKIKFGYTNSEFIYRDEGVDEYGRTHTGIVGIGDRRYSPVNTKLDIIALDPLDPNNWSRINHKPTLLNGTEPYSAGDFERKKISTSFPYDYRKEHYSFGLGLVGWDAITRTQGDLLILSEILKGGCESPTYDISVETDVWMGTDVSLGIDSGEKPLIPSPAAARLRSPNGDIVANAQRIQKNTVLDPTGNSFFIPATTFHNVKLKYREYIGVEIFKDNGIDNHIGINLSENKLYEQNLSDEYMDERTGEEFLGAVNGVNAKDYGMPLQPFPDFIKYYDTNENGYGCGEPIYEIVDDPANYATHDTVRGGDKRITGVTVNRNGNDITYPPGSIVAEGDADVGPDFKIYPFDANQYYFSDKAHPEKDIPFNNKYDLGEPIYYNKNYVDALMGDTFSYTKTYNGNLVKYVKPSQSAGHASPGSGNPVPVYIDVNDDSIVGIGDIRITKVRNKKSYNGFYEAFSKVTEGDTDVGLPLTSIPQFGVLHWLMGWNRFDDIYIDVDGNGYVSGVSGKSPQDGADIRLTDTLGYTAGSTVYDKNSDGFWQNIDTNYNPPLPADDRDVGDQPDPTTTYHMYDLAGIAPTGVTSDGLFFADIFGDGMYSPDDIQLNPLKVESNYIRLTEVTISDTTYSCGSSVSTGDYWYFQNPIHKIPLGLNCDFRFFDGAVLPGPLGLTVKMDQPLKVEQTTQIDISLTTPLKQGEEVWILLEDVLAPNPTGGMVNPDTIVKKLDHENQLATFQFTPYRGSCGELSTNYPVRLYAFKDTGGVREPVPYDQYVDEYWAPFLPIDELGNVITSYDIPVPPSPPLPKELQNAYDCFVKLEYNVSPEDLKVSSAQKCLEVLYQRFPNLTVRLFDGDNPNDVNDPANVRISIPLGHNLIANYNAHGGGVDYLFTGYDARFSHPATNNPKEPGNLPQNEKVLNNQNHYYGNKVIVQMNMDGTYYYWYWQDNYPYGVLDSGDIVAKSPIYPNDPDPDKNQPTYNKGYDRLTWENSDCSEKNTCLTCGGSDFRNMNIITKGDEFKLNGEVVFVVETFGVPSLVTNYGEITGGDPGGEIKIAVAPKDAVTKLKLRVYTMNAMYDYNSSIQHPPYFIYDPSPGIDYCGVKEFKVLPPDPYVNFAEFRIVDHALQNSTVNYTSGSQATSPLPYPTPQIQAPYDPIIKDVGKDFRCYPGGQTHTGRIIGSVNTGSFIRTEGQHNGWNAYPAIWWWYWYDDVDYNNFTDFNRLGTEFFPLTDYSMYFILKNSEGEHLSFSEDTPLDRKLKQVVVEGPFMQPEIFNEEKKTEITEWEYNGVRGIPLKYDYSGKIVIDVTNWTDYQYLTSSDFTVTQGFIGNQMYPKVNSYLLLSGDLNYEGLNDVFRIPEIIPIGFGVMTITVTLWDGTVKIYQDCCAEPPTDGVDSHGLSIVSDTRGITVGTDTKLELTVKENEVMQTVQPANDAVVVVWQDRGILNKNTGLYDGAGDGWITNPPQSSDATQIQYQYDRINDLNGDGKVSFVDYETEIIGTYDLATNTWMSGVIDARTFQRDNGKYIFDLSATNGALVTTAGFDFGGKKNEPDHIISEFEALPVIVTAYKYGDDNNDRAFSPRFSIADNIPQFSHEVYLSGQAKIDVNPALDLSLTISPTILTAGCIPELVDPAAPLTLIVTNAEGNPVDLTKGVPDNEGNIFVEKDDIWNYLFDDPHPEPLPQYYWLRTDLHNDDGTKINNQKLYNKYFNPIKPDFTLAKDGKYTFNGFCANDAGEFDVYVYTPDRTHMGVAKVKVELPDVTYSIVNYDDPSGTEYTVPGEPDFVLTAADNRIYRVTITAKDARGLLIKGVTKGVSTCGGGMKNTARFTPYSSRPASWDFVERDKFLFAEHFLQDLYPFHLNIGYDFNDNTKIDWQNSELYTLGGLNNLYKGLVYYNTTNVMYDDLTWEITPNPNLPPVSDTVTRKPISEDPNEPRRTDNPTGFAAIGWGYGSIYNSPYHGGYLFSDIDNNGFLDYHDSLGLDVNGQTTFYIFAEDLCYIGGLVGQNAYSNNAAEADLAGAPPPAKTDPAFVDKRFSPLYSHDGVFFLDWEAFPNNELVVAPPNLKVLDAENKVELSKDLLSKDNYDLVYSIENHLIIQVTPADLRDLPMKENGKVFLFGNQHQTAIYGNIKPSSQDPKIMETTIHFTPTGLGEGIASVGFYNLNSSYLKPPYDLKNTSTYVLMNLLKLDSNIGLYIEVFTDGPVIVNRDNELTVRVKEIGSLAAVEGAKVVIEGASIKGTKTTDKQGIAIFPIKPTQTGIIKITAEKDGRVIGRKEVKVIDDLSRPFLDIDPLPPFTNKGEVEVTGYTNPGNTVTVNNTVNATVDEKGRFSAKVTLKEGLNTIIVEAKNQRGEITKGSVSITLDTIPPNIFIDDPGYLVDVTEVEITGRTEPLCNVKVNGIPATLTHDIWKANVKVTLGTNKITVESTDRAGNTNRAEKEFYVYHRITMKLTIDNPVVLINDEPQPPLEYPPFISQGRTMVPVRIISEGLGADVNWDELTKTVTITLNKKTIIMTVGNSEVLVDGKKLILDAPPVIKNGRTFVPLRFISEAFGAQVTWDEATRTVTVIYDK